MNLVPEHFNGLPIGLHWVMVQLCHNVERKGGWNAPMGWQTLLVLEGLKQGLL